LQARSPATTVLEGIQAQDSNVTSVPSGQVVTDAQRAAAVAAMGSADAAVVVVGERAYAEGLGDNPTPVLAADQQSLIADLEATHKPVIIVMLAGRPLGFGPDKIINDASGLLMAYLPGTEGGAGVADVLFGQVNPSVGTCR
jgi:beta-glucosidase